MAVRGLVTAVRDGGATQVVDVETHEGVVRSGVEVMQQYGVTSRARAGALVVLVAIGGDQGDMVAMPVANPSDRMAGLGDGEVALHDAAGNRLHLRAGGVVELRGAASVLVVVGGTELEVMPGGVRILGDVTVTGSVTASGDVSAGGTSLQGHVHSGVQPGPNNTGTPV